MFTRAVVHPTAWQQYAVPAAAQVPRGHHLVHFTTDSEAWWPRRTGVNRRGRIHLATCLVFLLSKDGHHGQPCAAPGVVDSSPYRDFPIGRCPSADQSCAVTAYNFMRQDFLERWTIHHLATTPGRRRFCGRCSAFRQSRVRTPTLSAAPVPRPALFMVERPSSATCPRPAKSNPEISSSAR
jgi:hypothetical protein